MDINKKLIGSRIRAARLSRGMTSQRLSELIGINEMSLNHIECGIRGPSLKTMVGIADTLEVSLDYLTGRVQKLDETLDVPEIQVEGLDKKQTAALQEAAEGLAVIFKKYF